MFTGGPSLFRAKQSRHPNVHCFSSSVDAATFGCGTTRTAFSEAEDQARSSASAAGLLRRDRRAAGPGLDRPHRRGTPGVADRAGRSGGQDRSRPVCRVEPNIHYFGQRTYDELPGYLAGWDVCLLPFARNDATRVHQSDQDARIHGGGTARSSARRSPMWPSRTATSSISATRRRSSWPRARRR